MAFVFSPLAFVVPGAEQDAGEYSDAMRAQITRLRSIYPELAGWGDLAVESAWGAYSQDIHAVGWNDQIDARDNGFLAYVYVRTKNPNFDFLGTGLFSMDVWDYGDMQPWLQDAALPAWCGTV